MAVAEKVEEKTEDEAIVAEPEEEQVEEEEVEDVVDTLVPRAEPRTWIIRQTNNEGETLFEETFIQKPLSFFAKIEFFALLGDTIDQAMAGDDGVSLGSLLEGPSYVQGNKLNVEQFSDADNFIRAMTKLVRYSPTLLEDAYAIILGVPGEQRPWFKLVITSPEDKGGFSDDEGFEVLETFIDQNWDAIRDFFEQKIGALIRRVRERTNPKTESTDTPKPSSKPSKSTRRRTRKA